MVMRIAVIIDLRRLGLFKITSVVVIVVAGRPPLGRLNMTRPVLNDLGGKPVCSPRICGVTQWQGQTAAPDRRPQPLAGIGLGRGPLALP